MNAPSRILLVEDDASLAEAIRLVLESRGYEMTHVESGDAALPELEKRGFDLMICDYRLPGLGGMALLERARTLRPSMPVIMMTAFGSADKAIEASAKGAFDYLLKPFEMEELLATVQKAVTRSGHSLSKQGDRETGAAEPAMVGTSRVMQGVFKDIGRVAATNVSVLIQGETGTGKELVARALHTHSLRAPRPFVAVNCAAIPENLIESELFGHEKGAFTNAVARRVGRFEQAAGGTLFLDEVGDLPSATQAKLLRVLQERLFSRVGGREELKADVRVISATHRDLQKLIADGRFREDLYYRLAGAVIKLPPLRERPEDIPPLVRRVARRFATELNVDSPSIPADAMRVLETYEWPGNVRELENVIRQLVLESRGMPISPTLVRETMRQRITAPPQGVESSFAIMIRERLQAASRGETTSVYDELFDRFERELYAQAVELSFGNQSTIARWLGVSRLTVREKLDKFSLFPKRANKGPEL